MSVIEVSLRSENAELRRLLEKHQWAGLTPFKSTGAVPSAQVLLFGRDTVPDARSRLP